MATETFYTESGNSPPLAIVRKLTSGEHSENVYRVIKDWASNGTTPAALRVIDVLTTEGK